jgi:hypothetical protein
MSSRSEIIDEQVNWAESRGLLPDQRGYLPRVEGNLLRPLSGSAKAAFDEGGGSELVDTPSRPAKMKALHSSSALAVNVFDYWSDHAADVLGSALGLDDTITEITFEAQYPTGLPGNPPNLDVVLALASGDQFAIESKFTEWMQAKSTGKAPFKGKYFESSVGLWEQRDLSGCQKLAERMQAGETVFRHLDVAQLLKHALGLATQLGSAFSLNYLYYDRPSAEADSHKQEIEQFAAKVDNALRFSAVSYQELYPRLKQVAGDGHADYLGYLERRYFPEKSGV